MPVNHEAHTIVFENEKVYAIRQGKVIASGEDVDELEQKLENDTEDDEKSEDDEDQEDKSKKATHIVTPNGLKGKIVSRTAGLWSDEVTVRLENGNIAHYHVLADTEFVTEEDAPSGLSPIEELEAEVEEDYEVDRDSLEDRKSKLVAIRRRASGLIQKGASYADSQRLDKISLEATDEISQINDSLEAYDTQEAEAFAPPAPFDTQVVPQESFNGNKGEWLDDTLNDMISEAEGYDYEKLMSEGPETLVAEVPDTPLADQGAVQSIAASFIREKTAAADPVLRDKYEKTFLARVEQVRREELKNRKTVAKKQASAQEPDDNTPDESLFF